MKSIITIIFSIHAAVLFAQLPFGHEQAIYKDSSIVLSWATGCTVQRGFQNIADSASGLASAGDSSFATGKADGNNAVSLGDGGSATLTFGQPVMNGAGDDFVVFENGFSFGGDSLFFLELAFVEVSSDGQNYFTFASSSLTDTSVQIDNSKGINPHWLHNLAGKYIRNYGTPFDLEELKNIPGLDVDRITHIKIIDVVGSMNNAYARRDAYGRKINDPWPTPFASSGFDLDAVGVIHQQGQNGIAETGSVNESLKIYPLPVKAGDELHIVNESSSTISQVEILDLNGRMLWMQPNSGKNVTLNVMFEKGVYLLRLTGPDFVTVKKMIIE